MNKVSILEPTNLGEAMEFAKMISSSEMNMVPQNYRGKPNDILIAMQWGYEIGLAPMQALQGIAVINGKPSIYGDALLGLVRKDPRCMGIEEKIEGENETMKAICILKRKHIDGSIELIKREFSVKMAQRARLWGKQGPWTQYPERMLQHRARGNCIRDAFPDVIKGIITAEEARDYPPENQSPMKTVQVAEDTPSPMITDENTKHISDGLEIPIKYILKLTNGKNSEFDSVDSWAVEYDKVLRAIFEYDKMDHAERRTKMKELENLNEEFIDDVLPDYLRQTIKEQRIKFNKILSVDAREQDNATG
ncbi:MAG: putative recombination protein [Prokaryotic dsDNA virus sp.]|nr:MAG: putative recombination protein [Prokaryotic dsDNA virus sp.]